MLLALLGSFHAARQPLVAEVAGGADISQQWRSDYPIIYRMPCDAWFSHDKVQPCVFGPSDAEKTAMLLGDSIGVQWFSLVGMPYLEKDWRFIVLTKSSCPMVDQPYFYDRIKQIFSVCDQWRDKVLDRLAEWEPEVVVVGSASTYDFSDKEWVAGSQRVWEKIAQTGARVVVLPGTPTLEMDAPSCISKEMQNGGRDIVKACRSDQSDDAAYRVSSLLKHAAAGMPAVDVLDLNSWVCPSGICSAVTSDGVIVFRDSQHLTDSFVYSIAPQIAPQLKAFSTDDSSQSL